MYDALAVIPVAAVAYVATNMDNFSLLVGLLARYSSQRPAVAAGYVAGTAVLCAISFGIGEAAETAPLGYLGFLGVIPITIGVVWLVRAWRDRNKPAGLKTLSDSVSEKTVFALTLSTQLGNGTDTIITFGVLFADTRASADIYIVLTMAAMALLFVVAGIFGVTHPSLGRWLDRNAQRIAPFILIGVGLYIVANTASDVAT